MRARAAVQVPALRLQQAPAQRAQEAPGAEAPRARARQVAAPLARRLRPGRQVAPPHTHNVLCTSALM